MPNTLKESTQLKFSSDEVLVRVGWFISLKQIADKFEKKPTEVNKATLLGYISSAESIIKTLSK